jgi:hypothetical protein
MDRMPRYIPARERSIHLSKRRGDAMLRYIERLADAGDQKAVEFLNKLFSGGFDLPPDGARDSGICLR